MEGNIEHQAEFADTASGLVAAKLLAGKIGGFSSAIDENKNEFYGFDYVNQPNFLGNSFRGVVLDDVFSGNASALTYDDVYAAEQEEHNRTMIALLDSINIERNAASATIERLQLENEQLLSMLSRKGIDLHVALDNAFVLPVVVSGGNADHIEKSMSEFRSAVLPNLAPQPESNVVNNNPAYNRLLHKHGR